MPCLMENEKKVFILNLSCENFLGMDLKKFFFINFLENFKKISLYGNFSEKHFCWGLITFISKDTQIFAHLFTAFSSFLFCTEWFANNQFSQFPSFAFKSKEKDFRRGKIQSFEFILWFCCKTFSIPRFPQTTSNNFYVMMNKLRKMRMKFKRGKEHFFLALALG